MPYSIEAYSIEKLKEILSRKANLPKSQVDKKQHIPYLKNYFDSLKAETILIEHDYVDHDYLEDYASYYVKCFHTYERKCSRLHFFNVKFTKEDFDTNFFKASWFSERLKNNYLGFLVIKPLPKTIIGRTCLKTYPSEEGRAYPITRKYKANLFGIPLDVETLAYQEQDSVAAACATSALWSAFQGTGVLFHHAIPSPIEITKAATKTSLAEKRSLPNNGLTTEQMAQAIKSIGLEPFTVAANVDVHLKSTVYSYIRAGVPVILCAKLADTSVHPNEWMGGHAVALTGYRIGENGPTPFPGTSFYLKSLRIEKFYAHDDQIGPFARMCFDGQKVTDQNGTQYTSLASSWYGTNGRGPQGCGRFVPEVILVPLYHKIRIPFETILNLTYSFDSHLNLLVKRGLLSLNGQFEWDIFLSTQNHFRRDVIKANILNQIKMETLGNNHPRFIWRAIASIGDENKLELVFDATDIVQGNLFIRAIPYDKPTYNMLVTAFSQAALLAMLEGEFAFPIFKWFSYQKPL